VEKDTDAQLRDACCRAKFGAMLRLSYASHFAGISLEPLPAVMQTQQGKQGDAARNASK
jgi:hypothetical protein